MCKVFSCTILLILCTGCCGYRVLLLFPFPSNSYALLGEKYVKLLMKADHEVTYVTPFPIKNAADTLRQIPVASNVKLISDKLRNITNILDNIIDWVDYHRHFKTALKISNATVFDGNVQKLLQDPNEEFDVVIADWFYSEILSGFAAIFNCPLIWATSMEANAFVLKLLNEINTPYYVFGRPSFTFGQWITEQYRFLHMKYNRWLISDKERSLFNKAFGPAMAKRGRVLPSFEAVKYNGSLVLGNSHAIIDRAPGLPMNYVPVAGYHIEDNGVLPKNIQTIMDNAKEGVIVFSMGSDFKGKTLPEELRDEILDVFEEINTTVIWKYEGNIEVPDNVHTVSWLPQQNILAHPKCSMLISGGGLLSMNEAMYFGVPVIGIPFLNDHANNIERAINKGYALKVELNNISSNLKAAIDEILNNSTYKEKALELSAIYRDRPLPPSQELIFWIEHVIRTQGALHLRSSLPLMPWYHNLYFRLTFLAIIVIAVVGVILKLFLLKRRREDDFEFKKFI